MSSIEKGPVVYFTVVDASLEELEAKSRKMTDGLIEAVRSEFDGYRRESFSSLLREAYVRGMKDGFAQGVAAEVNAPSTFGEQKQSS